MIAAAQESTAAGRKTEAPSRNDPGGSASAAGTPRERQLFEFLVEPGGEQVSADRICELLRETGLRREDPRLARTTERIRHAPAGRLDYEAFRQAIAPSVILLERALTRRMVIPDFGGFSRSVERMFDDTRKNREGAVASYIPQLARVEPEQFGLGVCTADGQRLALGDACTAFSVQSTWKPLGYCLALEENGEDVVHRHIGREPSGQSFNELALNKGGLPHNPMINAGAIMSSALIRPRAEMADRFEHVLAVWERMAGGTRPGFSNTTYLSERRTADRNFALGYFMRENDAFPDGTDLVETLEFYFQCCSLEMTADLFSVVAATLANGGICPITGETVLRPGTVQRCLSLMYSCGMYDFSGEWAFSVGLPAKSGVSGIVLVVVPNVLGLAVWSPRLDEHGNSVRGIELSQRMVGEFNFHNYDSLVGGAHGKTDPRLDQAKARGAGVVDLCWAASEGDLNGLRRLIAEGADPDASDYDGRTPLHLAAAEGETQVVEFLLSRGVDPRPIDRWGNTPLDDARRSDHADVQALLEVER